jgi:4-amino-4-deoxy-L-arabinose transferase-like glycosyltransferase
MLWIGRRAPRTSGQRAQVLLWGSWLIVTGLTFSLAAGIIHPYYSVALAPAIGALVGIGGVGLWRQRQRLEARAVLAATVAVNAVWSHQLVGRTPAWHPDLRTVILVVGLVTAGAIIALPYVDRRFFAIVAAAAVFTGMAGPAAYSLQTVANVHTGAIPSAGPAGQGFAGPGGGRGRAFGGPGGARGNFTPPAGAQAGPGGALGGLLDTSTPSAALVSALRTNASSYTWVAAAVGSNSAAGVQLASGLPVMAIGGFNGTDPTPTLAAFQALVKAGKVHYFLASGGGGFGRGGGGPGGGSASSSAITSWVEQTYPATTIGGVTVYDLTASA